MYVWMDVCRMRLGRHRVKCGAVRGGWMDGWKKRTNEQTNKRAKPTLSQVLGVGMYLWMLVAIHRVYDTYIICMYVRSLLHVCVGRYVLFRIPRVGYAVIRD
ncbi:uncharacterized protein GGS25DRAFT_475772 [Hypoxylon fragiforme]|uniref:uncharacterized protein n=1 Tax=Hypoxylon fragiforme TaxID=63214 RepID=UPI0020C5EF34|nr:uncharacterized protein GGS25DRAFT_475772 [Hypoxylon fragiforme]KAI2612523.1 hypothetical protein GGS25DRAFT_475772 [Hypoxylon fragiforme]